MAIDTAVKTSWADDVDEDQIEETVDASGVRTVVEYTTNEEGKKIKITRRIRRIQTRTLVKVAERKQWAKFGKEKGSRPGPDKATTTVGEHVSLKLSAGSKTVEAEPDREQEIKAALGGKKIMCRLCKGDHFTSKCPYKDTLEPLGVTSAELGDDTMPPTDDHPGGRDTAGAAAALSGGAGGGGGAGGKYVPPSMRAGGNRAGESMVGRGGGPGGAGGGMMGNREDLPTLRVTNVSEDANEDDLRELFSKFGRVVRVYIGRDRETGQGKGYAFVSFEDRGQAARAMEKVHGLGYDNLILNCQWSQPREQRP